MIFSRKIYVYSFLFLLYINISFTLSAQQLVRVACIGNSVTYGLTHKNPQLTSYPSQLQSMLGEKYLVKNFGVSGATLLKKGHRPYYKEPAFAEMLSLVPDIAIIHLGLNDTDPRDWPDYRDDFMADYSSLIDTIRTVNPHVKIFICKLSPIFSDHPRFRSGTRDWYWQVQQMIMEIATANNAGLIDFHSTLYSRPDLLPDALHPNEEGAAILARTVYQKITGDFGGLKLAPVFASHMVLQRNRPIKFYGTANTNEKIRINFAGKQQQAVVDSNGKWIAVFPALPVGGPYSAIIISENKKIDIEDILIGEVWLCSGQSNMLFPLKSEANYKDEMKAAEAGSEICLLHMQPVAETNNAAWDTSVLEKVNKLEYFSGTWRRIDSSNAKNFSAVAYYFGKRLYEQLKIPIGLIQVAVGGSTTESWIDRYTMEHHPVLVNELINWRESDFFQPWTRERAAVNLANSIYRKQRHPYEPCYNYEAVIKQFIDLSIQGVIWYQGESNAHNVELHEIVFEQLVKSWRNKFGDSLPFYYVQLSSVNRPSWPSFRYSQLQLLKKIPFSGMAVSSDLGDSTNVHPIQKKPIGERLARLALFFTYKNKNVMPYGPLWPKAIKQNNKLIISFDYTGGLLKTADGALLRGFTLVNMKGQKFETKPYIIKDKVIIPLTNVHDVKEVLYGWEGYTDANLVNKDNLPASTFRLRL